MADISQVSSSSSSDGEKAVVVRVKRKSTQMRVDAFWLEINERPLKRPLLDFGNLSISSSSTGKEKLKTKKLLVKHVETANSSERDNVLQSFMPNSANAKEFRMKLEQRRHMFKQDKKQDQLRSVARQKHEDLVRNARFKQLWKSRKGNREGINDPIHKLCHLYDVVRVDVEEEMSSERQELNDSLLKDDTILCNYMPLLREFLPTAAAEIEADMKACLSQQDGYVYDFYTMGDDSSSADEDDLPMYPVVQVDDDNYYDGPIQSEFESDDSNAEDNPQNDYPDEESSEENEAGSSSDQSEADELESSNYDEQSEHENYVYEEGDDWRWDYR